MNTQLDVVGVETLDYLPAKTLLRLVEQGQKVKKWSALFNLTVGKHPDLFRHLEEADIEVLFCMRTGDIDMNFTGDGERLKTVWIELRRNGYKPSSHPKKGDSSFSTHWRKDEFSPFWMNFSSSVCRRVQVGTQMVETPIYETQCGELPEIEAVPELKLIDGGADDLPF